MNFSVVKKIPRTFWIFFFIFIILVCVILLILPWIYGLPFFVATKPNEAKYLLSNPNLAKSIQRDLNISQVENKNFPGQNRLLIPKIGVDSEILEGENIDVLNSQAGVLREKDNAKPNQAGNTVIAGHRFQYLPPNTNTFYHLDKLSKGDLIIIYWRNDQGQMQDYYYEVFDTKTVNPSDTSIRNTNPEISNQLTLYTCGPNVYESSQRIAIFATLKS